MQWRRFLYGILSLMGAFAVSASSVQAAAGIQGTPKIINLYLNWQLREDDLAQLARWDAVVLDADQQARYPDRVRKLRALNPSIKIFAYLPSEEIAQSRFSEPSDYPFAKLASRIQEAWYLKDPAGNHAFFWPGSSLLNVTNQGPVGPTGQRWNDFFPQFLHDEVLSSGMWDGVFLDNTFDGISPFAKSSIDLDRDGRADTAANADRAWREGMTKMLKRIHELNPNAIVIGNGGAAYADLLNGAFFEHFPSSSWGPNWRDFRDSLSKNRAPSFTAINVNTDNQDRQGDYRLMRYGLTSAVVGGGYYSFDKGDWGHDVIWWYDEYETPIGPPRAAPRVLSGSTTGIQPAVWARDTQNGLAVLNSTASPQHVVLPGVFEKVHGVQDTHANDGSLVTSIDLAARDGLLLLRRSEATEIKNSAYVNGSFVRMYDAQGRQKQNGFFAQRTDAPSGALVVSADVDRDGTDDLIVAERGSVSVRYGNGRAATAFAPFGASYKGVLSLAVANTNRDENRELIIAKDGKPPEVKIFSFKGVQLAHWNAYTPVFGGGVRVAAGDIDGNGLREIVTGAGPGGGPHIRIWKTDGTVWGGSFFAFDQTEAGGVSVAVGDVDHDGTDEIIVGSGRGAIPRVRIFDGRGTLEREIKLGTVPLSGGVTVMASDVDGDGAAEILVTGLPTL